VGQRFSNVEFLLWGCPLRSRLEQQHPTGLAEPCDFSGSPDITAILASIDVSVCRPLQKSGRMSFWNPWPLECRWWLPMWGECELGATGDCSVPRMMTRLLQQVGRAYWQMSGFDCNGPESQDFARQNSVSNVYASSIANSTRGVGRKARQRSEAQGWVGTQYETPHSVALVALVCAMLRPGGTADLLMRNWKEDPTWKRVRSG